VSPVNRPALDDCDAVLLRALRERYRADNFDEHHVSVDAPQSPELLNALSFLGVKVNRRHRALSYPSHALVARWLDRVEGLPVAGLRLAKDRIGWARVEAVGLGATGCTGAAG
jgi:hypothetical protein